MFVMSRSCDSCGKRLPLKSPCLCPFEDELLTVVLSYGFEEQQMKATAEVHFEGVTHHECEACAQLRFVEAVTPPRRTTADKRHEGTRATTATRSTGSRRAC